MNIYKIIKTCCLIGFMSAMTTIFTSEVFAGQLDNQTANNNYPLLLQNSEELAPIMRDTNSASVIYLLGQDEIDKTTLFEMLATPLVSDSYVLNRDGQIESNNTTDIVLSRDNLDIGPISHLLNDVVGFYQLDVLFMVNNQILTLKVTDEVINAPSSFILKLDNNWNTPLTSISAELNQIELPLSQLMVLIKNNIQIKSNQNLLAIDTENFKLAPDSLATIDMNGITFKNVNTILSDVKESWKACLNSEVTEGLLKICFNTIFVPNRYIIKLNESFIATNSSNIKTIARQLNNKYQGKLRYIFEQTYIGFSADFKPAVIQLLAQDAMVSTITRNEIAHKLTIQDNPPSWGLDRIDERVLELDEIFEYHSTGDGVNIYILDSGIRATHEEFTGRVEAGANFVGVDITNTDDCDGHGTHVAGTAAGTSVGVAKEATIIPVRVLDCDGAGNTDEIIAGIEWITTNATAPAVVNVSIGFASPTIVSAIDDAIEDSIATGITYVIAAGNSDRDACGYSFSRIDEAITVGASKRKRNIFGTVIGDKRAGFSNFGSCIDIFAPGKRIRSASSTTDGWLTTMSGTSMAAPHVAGIAALFLENSPTSTPATVMSEIIDSATNVVTNVGSGSPNLLAIWDSLPPPPASAIRIKNESFSKCIYPYASGGMGTTRFYNWACWGDPSFAFLVTPTDTPNEVLLLSNTAGLCLKPLNDENYEPIGASLCTSPDNIYIIDYITVDTFRLKNKNNNKCLYGSPINGGLIRQFGCWDNPDMIFSFESY